MTTKQIKEALGTVADTVGRNKAGNYVARRGFFYRHGGTAENFAATVAKLLPGAVILNKWEKWTRFNGGASTASGSHFGCEFNFPETETHPAVPGVGAAVEIDVDEMEPFQMVGGAR